MHFFLTPITTQQCDSKTRHAPPGKTVAERLVEYTVVSLLIRQLHVGTARSVWARSLPGKMGSHGSARTWILPRQQPGNSALDGRRTTSGYLHGTTTVERMAAWADGSARRGVEVVSSIARRARKQGVSHRTDDRGASSAERDTGRQRPLPWGGGRAGGGR